MLILIIFTLFNLVLTKIPHIVTKNLQRSQLIHNLDLKFILIISVIIFESQNVEINIILVFLVNILKMGYCLFCLSHILALNSKSIKFLDKFLEIIRLKKIISGITSFIFF
jgi:hypothetical protein